MEQKLEEIAASETAEIAEFTERDCNISTNPTEPEVYRPVAPSSFGVSISSDWPGSSVLTNLNTVKDYSLNRGEMSLVDSTPTLTRSYPMNDVGFTVEEAIDRNYEYPSACVAGCSSTKEGNNEPGRWLCQLEREGQNNRIAGEELMSKDKGWLESSLREDFRRVLSTFQNVKNLSSNQKNVVHVEDGIISSDQPLGGSPSKSLFFSDTISTHAMVGPNNIISSSKPPEKNLSSNQKNVVHVEDGIISSDQPLGGSPSKSLFFSDTISTHAMVGPNNIISSSKPPEGSFSSSFSKFFLGRSLKTKRKGVDNENPGASDESRTKTMVQHKTRNTVMAQNENMYGYSSGEAENSLNSQLHSHDIVKEEPETPHCGINLREWLESKGVNVSKNDKLRLFRKIVQTVDVVHNQGVAMMELRPSSFIMLETGDVEYIGSLMETMNQDNTKKRGLEQKIVTPDNFREKMQKVGEDKWVRPETRIVSRFVMDKATNQFTPGKIDTKNRCHSMWDAKKISIYKGTSTGNSWLTPNNSQLEKKWYAFPEGFKIMDLLSLNVYSLGLLLFEFLCHFESIKAHSTAMFDLHHRILPPRFLSESPKEAGLCFWLLHPEPSSRPTTREILQSELIYGSESTSMSNDETSCADMVDDAELELLLHFLVTLKQHKQNKASNLLECVDFLNTDINTVESRQACRKYLDTRGGSYDADLKDHRGAESSCSASRMNALRDKLLEHINELENVYLSLRSNVEVSEIPNMDRSDKDVLRKRERLSWVQPQHNLAITEEKSVDRVGIFFDGICKFARYKKFEVCGTLRNGDILNSNNVICSLSFDREEDYIAAAGVSKKIKIFELASLLDDFVDVQYPVLEMSSKSKFSCICWNNYIRSYLASTDYDGLVQMWDASTGQGIAQYNEHKKRAWSVDFSRVDPTRFASGGDDCSLRIWSINERNSMCAVSNPANICCVQFSPYSSHLLAFGSANYRIYCYDLRHTRIPWCTLVGHDNAVSYARFLDSDTLVSASTDNTLKLWDLNKTSLDGLSTNACSLTLTGHTNEKNFVGLGVLDGYIACGSETNEVYAYYRSLPVPITSHKFGYIDPISGDEIGDGDGHFVSSVCWRSKSQMLAAANSSGSIKILRMA